MANTGDGFYQSKEWRRVRAEILERDLWCCQLYGTLLTPGRTDPDSAVVDHIIPRSMAPELELDPGNLWSVSKQAHDSVCASIERRQTTPQAIAQAKLEYRTIGIDGYPVKVDRSEAICLHNLLWQLKGNGE